MDTPIALLLQEPLAAASRIRLGETPSDAEFFRKMIIDSLRQAEEQARARGYTGKDTKLSIFAVAAMVDETVLGSRAAAFAEWHRQPLCLQIFSTNLGGEIFFENVRLLLERDNNRETADVLEVYLLCLLLGFAGKYKNNEATEVRQLTRAIREKIDRIRGGNYALPDVWKLPAEQTVRRTDPLVRRLKIAAIAAACLAIATFTISKVHLNSAVNELRDLAGVVTSHE
jgi:type IV/VI secretion system ImpK/VasF family protein